MVAVNVVVCSTTVQSADKDNLVTVLQNVVSFALQFPVSVVDEDENARTTVESTRRRKVVQTVSSDCKYDLSTLKIGLSALTQSHRPRRVPRVP